MNWCQFAACKLDGRFQIESKDRGSLENKGCNYDLRGGSGKGGPSVELT